MILANDPNSNSNNPDASGQGNGLEFPCEIPLKAMGKSEAGLKELVVTTISRHVSVDISRVRSRPSKGGKYESITVTVHLETRSQMEQIYGELSRHDQVLWTL